MKNQNVCHLRHFFKSVPPFSHLQDMYPFYELQVSRLGLLGVTSGSLIT